MGGRAATANNFMSTTSSKAREVAEQAVASWFTDDGSNRCEGDRATLLDAITAAIEKVVGEATRQPVVNIQRQANVRLIAAAPDLLEACKELVASVERWNGGVEKIIGRVPKSGMFLDRAKAAIARAEGKDKP